MQQMNIQLTQVLSDVTGLSGLAIIGAILEGERDPVRLASLVDRRMKARLGAAEGVTATAHKLARTIFRLIKHGEAYVRQGLEDYEKKFQARKLNALQKAAKAMGFELISKPISPVVS